MDNIVPPQPRGLQDRPRKINSDMMNMGRMQLIFNVTKRFLRSFRKSRSDLFKLVPS
ncbi:MAG: hypothetical protein LBR80_02820 [Deltaproteobacteria bacterium]|nr:hypothetical protein [Deltaproteobacteria bacterium]